VTVFITQELRGRDVTDATEFGDLEILTPANEQTSYSTQPTIRKMRNLLYKFTDQDYLLLAGDPVGIAIAAAIVSEHNRGKFKMLKWDRLENKYLPLQADIRRRF
jgi:hypothetical protein